MPQRVCAFQRSVSWHGPLGALGVGSQQGRFYALIKSRRDEVICERIILPRQTAKIKAGPVDLIDFVDDNP